MKPATALETRIIVNMTDEQLDRAADYLNVIPLPWTEGQMRAADLFIDEHHRRRDGLPVPKVPGAGITL